MGCNSSNNVEDDNDSVVAENGDYPKKLKISVRRKSKNDQKGNIINTETTVFVPSYNSIQEFPLENKDDVDLVGKEKNIFDNHNKEGKDLSSSGKQENEMEKEVEQRNIDLLERWGSSSIIQENGCNSPEDPLIKSKIKIAKRNFFEASSVLLPSDLDIDTLQPVLEELVDALMEIDFKCEGFHKLYRWITTLGSRDSSEKIGEEERLEIIETVEEVNKLFSIECVAGNSLRSDHGKDSDSSPTSRVQSSFLFTYSSLIQTLQEDVINIREILENLDDIIKMYKILGKELKTGIETIHADDIQGLKKWRDSLRSLDPDDELLEEDSDDLLESLHKYSDSLTRTFEKY